MLDAILSDLTDVAAAFDADSPQAAILADLMHTVREAAKKPAEDREGYLRASLHTIGVQVESLRNTPAPFDPGLPWRLMAIVLQHGL